MHPGYLFRPAIRTVPWIWEWLVGGCRVIPEYKGWFYCNGSPGSACSSALLYQHHTKKKKMSQPWYQRKGSKRGSPGSNGTVLGQKGQFWVKLCSPSLPPCGLRLPTPFRLALFPLETLPLHESTCHFVIFSYVVALPQYRPLTPIFPLFLQFFTFSSIFRGHRYFHNAYHQPHITTHHP